MALGWNISIHRQADDGWSPPELESAQGPCVAVWQTGVGGLSRIHELVADGRATLTGSTSGHPDSYTARARDPVPTISDGPPGANAKWRADPTDVLVPSLEGPTRLDRGTLEACSQDEWPNVKAWDRAEQLERRTLLRELGDLREEVLSVPLEERGADPGDVPQRLEIPRAARDDGSEHPVTADRVRGLTVRSRLAPGLESLEEGLALGIQNDIA